MVFVGTTVRHKCNKIRAFAINNVYNDLPATLQRFTQNFLNAVCSLTIYTYKTLLLLYFSLADCRKQVCATLLKLSKLPAEYWEPTIESNTRLEPHERNAYVY